MNSIEAELYPYELQYVTNIVDEAFKTLLNMSRGRSHIITQEASEKVFNELVSRLLAKGCKIKRSSWNKRTFFIELIP